MKICISELGFIYVIQLLMVCLLSCFLSALIGMFGFAIFAIAFISLILICYIFRFNSTIRTLKNRHMFLSTCDGILISSTKTEDNKNTYIFKCGFFDQYYQYVPCDCNLHNITYFPKNHYQYPNGVMFAFSNQTNGDFTIIVTPKEWGKNSTVLVLLEPNTYVNAGESICSVNFGSTVVLICNFKIEMRLNSYVMANNTTFN